MPHIHDQIDFVADVYVVFKNKVLIRKHDKYKMWLPVGGHIELDEDPNAAAIREVKEEVGLDVILDDALLMPMPKAQGYQELIPPYHINRHPINDHHDHIALVYFAKADSDIISQDSKDEQSEDCRWLTKNEVLAHPELSDTVRAYALHALEVLSSRMSKQPSA